MKLSPSINREEVVQRIWEVILLCVPLWLQFEEAKVADANLLECRMTSSTWGLQKFERHHRYARGETSSEKEKAAIAGAIYVVCINQREWKEEEN